MINNIKNKKTVIILGGPTASGKSKLAISLAKNIDGEIINSDSSRSEYFNTLLSKQPKVTVNRYKSQDSNSINIVNGIYTFTLADGQQIPAYYTFVFHFTQQEGWKIVLHHSTPVKSVLDNSNIKKKS